MTTHSVIIWTCLCPALEVSSVSASMKSHDLDVDAWCPAHNYVIIVTWSQLPLCQLPTCKVDGEASRWLQMVTIWFLCLTKVQDSLKNSNWGVQELLMLSNVVIWHHSLWPCCLVMEIWVQLPLLIYIHNWKTEWNWTYQSNLLYSYSWGKAFSPLKK